MRWGFALLLRFTPKVISSRAGGANSRMPRWTTWPDRLRYQPTQLRLDDFGQQLSDKPGSWTYSVPELRTSS